MTKPDASQSLCPHFSLPVSSTTVPCSEANTSMTKNSTAARPRLSTRGSSPTDVRRAPPVLDASPRGGDQ